MSSRFEDLSKYTWRTVEGVRQRRVKVRLEIDGRTPEELTERIAEAGLTEARIDLEKEWEYGDEYARLYLNGWRAATDEEVTEALAERDETIARDLEWKRRQLADIRRSNPELLSEEG